MKLNAKHSGRRWLFLGLLLCMPALLQALPSDKDQPIDVEADGVDLDDRKGVSVYKGNVVLSQGSIVIKADRVTVTQRSDGADQIVAEGRPVTFRQDMGAGKGLIKGRANRTEYLANSETVLMIGDAVLTQGEDTFTSDRITYDRAKAVVRAGASAQGKQRVKVTIGGKKN